MVQTDLYVFSRVFNKPSTNSLMQMLNLVYLVLSSLGHGFLVHKENNILLKWLHL